MGKIGHLEMVHPHILPVIGECQSATISIHIIQEAIQQVLTSRYKVKKRLHHNSSMTPYISQILNCCGKADLRIRFFRNCSLLRQKRQASKSKDSAKHESFWMREPNAMWHSVFLQAHIATKCPNLFILVKNPVTLILIKKSSWLHLPSSFFLFLAKPNISGC